MVANKLVVNSTLRCEYQPRCPGCPRFGQSGLSAQGVDKLRQLALLWGDSAVVEEHPCEGRAHRLRARLSVRGRTGDLKVGIFEEKSHRLVSIPSCPVHHPSINLIVSKVVELSNRLGIAPYDELRHQGQLRAVQCAVQPKSGRVQLTLLIAQKELTKNTLDRNIKELCLLLEKHTHSLFLATLPEKTNALLGHTWLHMSGPDMMEDQVPGALVHYPPDAFGQANPALHAQAVAKIHTYIEPQSTVTEYYAGVGSIGLGLLHAGCRVVFNEIGGGSIRGLQRALVQYDAGTWRVLEGRAGAFCDAYNQDDTVIVDPPRKGLEAELLTRFTRDAPKRLIYLSCGLDALVSEATALHQSGHYSLRALSAWAYFPFTEHIESLLVLERRS